MRMGYATVFRWIKAGKLISVKLNGRTYIPASEIARVRKMRDTQKGGD